MRLNPALTSISTIFDPLLYRLGLSSLAMSHASDIQRVWVQYRPGKKETVHALLKQAEAKFHYDFSDLDSFVVTLPQRSVSHLMRNPDILDVWYAQVMSRFEPAEERSI